jgi:hypothetical protein
VLTFIRTELDVPAILGLCFAVQAPQDDETWSRLSLTRQVRQAGRVRRVGRVGR